MPLYLHHLNTDRAGSLLPDSLIVIPVGSIEQHCSAPLGLDALISEALAARACLRAEEQGLTCIILPTIYYGFSYEWLDSPGTISLSPNTLITIISEIVGSLAIHGARKFALLNGHGGNSGVLEAAARVASRRNSVVVGVVDYWRLAGLRIGHCDEIEEALMKELLSIDGSCSCRERVEFRRYRVSTSRLPVGSGGGGSPPIGLGELVDSIAEAFIELYNTSVGDPVL